MDRRKFVKTVSAAAAAEFILPRSGAAADSAPANAANSLEYAKRVIAMSPDEAMALRKKSMPNLEEEGWATTSAR